MSKDHAWSSFMILVNSSTKAGYDSYVVGSSSSGTHVRATGRSWRPSKEVKDTSMSSHVMTSLPVQK